MADRSVRVRLDATTEGYNRAIDGSTARTAVFRHEVDRADGSVTNFSRNADGAGRSIDKFSGRLRLLADAAVVIGPAFAPIGAVAIPAVAGLASEFGFATVAAGTALLAFRGVGDALKAMDKAALVPTATNLEAARVAMDKIGPSAQSFVRELQALEPKLQQLQALAANGLLPGVGAGLKDLEGALPRVEAIVSAVSTELGFIARNTGAALSSDRWAPFLDFIATEAPRALGELSHIVGNSAHALAELWMAFTPLDNGFSGFLLKASHDLDVWAAGLSKTQGFADFVNYVQTNGPQVADTFGALADALIQITEAAAPLGGPVLQALEGISKAVGAIADSDLGTPIFTAIAALSLFNRTVKLTELAVGTTFGAMVKGEVAAATGIRTLIADMRALQSESNLSRIAAPAPGFIGPATQAQAAAARLRTSLPALAKTSALIGGITIAATGAADSIGLTNTASLGLAGTIAGPFGAALGAATGLLIDASHASDGVKDSITRLNQTVASGDLTTAGDQVKDLQKKFNDLGHGTGLVRTVASDLATDLKTVGGLFGDNTPIMVRAADALINAQNALAGQRAQQATARVEANWTAALNGVNLTKEGLDRATTSADNLREALQRAQDVLTGRGAAREFEAAVDNFADRAKKRLDLQTQLKQAQEELTRDKGKGKAGQRENDRQRIADLEQQLAAAQNSIDINLPQGRQTLSDLDQIASTAITFAQTITNPVLQQKFLDSARNEFISAAREAGYAKTAAEELATEVGLLNTVKGQPKIDINTITAQAKLTTFDVFLNDFLKKPRKLTISTELKNPGKPGGLLDLLLQTNNSGSDDGTANARGGFYPGDVANRHQPELAGPGKVRIWREPETMGEAYIPLANDGRRAGAISVWERTGQALGVEFRRYAFGGGTGLPIQSASGGDLQLLAGMVSKMQPRVGRIYMQPHNYNRFRQEILDDHLADAAGGSI